MEHQKMKNKKRTALFRIMTVLLFVFSSFSVYAQTTVKGIVTDQQGEPIIGASVIEKGTTNGVITDIEGTFSIKTSSSNATLSFSYLGYIQQDIALNGKTTLNIILQEDNVMLNEVVVVGYGTMKKSDLTGSVARINAEKISKTAPISIGDILRTGAPGLIVGADNSAAGEGGSLLIRGQRSLNASTSPLIVVDGVVFYGSLYELNKNDIESIDVLKDASSAAVYGAKSANGVITITTKKGKSDKPTVNFNLNVAAVTKANDRKVYDANGFLQFRSDLFNSTSRFETPGKWILPTSENLSKHGLSIDEWRAYGGSSSMTGSDADTDIWLQRIGLYTGERDGYFAGKTYDWYKNSFQTGLRQDYNVSISGKSDKVNYYVSLGALDSEGIIKENEYKQYTANMKLNGQITSFLEIGVNANYSNRTNSDFQQDWAGSSINNSPFSQYLDTDGNLNPYPNGLGGLNTGQNDDYVRQFKRLKSDYNYLNASLFAKVKLPFNLSFETTFAPRFGWFKYRYHESSASILVTNGGTAERTNQDWYDWQIDNIIRWDYTFVDKHHFNVTLLQNSEEHFSNYEKNVGTHFNPTDVLGWNNMKAATEYTTSTDDTHSTGNALMARLFYSFDSRYMLTGSIRRDGYSAFGKSTPYATFPALAFAWSFANEPFFRWEPMSMGKLRLSWGQNGNRDIGIYEALANLSAGQVYAYARPDGTVYNNLLFWQNRMANHDLKWERTTSINVGLDFGFFNNRVNGSFEYYHMPTKDLLVKKTLPTLGGFNDVMTNLGEVLNTGFEMTLNTNNIKTKDLSWSTTIGLSHNKNEIKHLFYTYDADGKEVDEPGNNWFIGKPIGVIWNYKFDGIWQENEVEEANKYGQRPGDPKILDKDGNYKYDNSDKEFMGQTAPKVRWTMRNEFSYKNFDFSFNMYSYLGHKAATTEILNNAGWGTDRGNSYVREGYWTPENPTNEYARLWSNYPVTPQKVIKKDFVRIDNISLSYTVPKSFCNKIVAQSLRITASVNNAFVITGWNYWDPEISGPMPRTFTFGANVTF
jgi:TonB-linked SusC/RagA family outer membrane protein